MCKVKVKCRNLRKALESFWETRIIQSCQLFPVLNEVRQLSFEVVVIYPTAYGIKWCSSANIWYLCFKAKMNMSTEENTTNSYKSVRFCSLEKVFGKFPVKLFEESTLQLQYCSNETTKSFINVKKMQRKLKNYKTPKSRNKMPHKVCKLIKLPSSGGTMPENRFASRHLFGKKNN